MGQEAQNLGFQTAPGVEPSTFKAMVRCLEAWKARKKRPGRTSRLSSHDQVLMTLEHLRDYPTLFRLGFDWGVDETTVSRVVRKVERILLESGAFRMPGKRKWEEGVGYEAIVADVGEVPIQRPQKTAPVLQRQAEHPEGAGAGGSQDSTGAVRGDRPRPGTRLPAVQTQWAGDPANFWPIKAIRASTDSPKSKASPFAQSTWRG